MRCAAVTTAQRRRWHFLPLALAVALLSCCSCLVSSSSSTAPAGRDPFARDPELDVALSELLTQSVDLALSPFDVQLQLASAQCRGELSTLHGNRHAWRSSSNGGDDTSDDAGDTPQQQKEEKEATAVYCKRVRYVRQTREKLRVALRVELQAIEQAQQQEVGQEEQDQPEVPQPNEISTRSARELNLQEFFETYAEVARPVVLAAEPLSLRDDGQPVLGFASGDELAQFRAKCFDAMPPSHRHRTRSNLQTVGMPLKIHDPECAPLLERFHVPLFLVHDYVRRTNVSLSETYLPSLVRITQQASYHHPEVLACPHGLHMLAMVFPDVTAESETDPGAVDVQVFDQRFKPLFQQSSRGQAHLGVEEVAVSATSGGLSDRKDDNHLLPRVAPEYRTQELPSLSFLFVPGSQFATIQPGDKDQTLTLLRFCFVDASNFNTVKQEVAVDALVDGDAYTLLQSLQSQAFDRSMFRRPLLKDTLWTNFVAWPRETKLLKKSDLLNSEAGSEQLQLSRRERLKQWQDDKRWDRRVQSLTLPVSLPPVVINATRNSATLRFQDLYNLPKHDITAYGYVVRWKNVDDELGMLTPQPGDGADSPEASGTMNAMNITRRQIVRSALPTALFGDDFDGKDIEAVVSGLKAETRYTFSVQIYVDDTSGLESDSSRIVLTTPCSEPSGVRGVPRVSASAGGATCATLKWLEPIDDGGKRLGLYLINTRIVESALDALMGAQDALKTVEDEKIYTLDANFASDVPEAGGGAWKSAQVCNLVPGATYVLRVAAMNSIGAGPWSSRSDPLVVPSARHSQASTVSSSSSRRNADSNNIPTLKGRGDPAYVPMRSFSLRELSDLIALHGPKVVIATLSESQSSFGHKQQQSTQWLKVILSDVNEKIVVRTSDNEAPFSEGKGGSTSDELSFDVWSSHFSPRSFHVSSELVRADPLDASIPLRNADQVKDRVVLVTRGAVPFVFKAHHAQQAGALGIIIADVNDTCQGRFDQQCVPGADKSHGEGFAALDKHELWLQNRIPCVLALQEASQRLLELVAP
ncbi:hypothetical protein Gpo141_00000991 [Globisporangium polare]